MYIQRRGGYLYDLILEHIYRNSDFFLSRFIFTVSFLRILPVAKVIPSNANLVFIAPFLLSP